jgi:hypothetical protein
MKEFEAIAIKLRSGNVAVWTDGCSLESDNERPCLIILEENKKYKVTIELINQ